MTYDLDVFRGELEQGEQEWQALDISVAERVLEDVTGSGRRGQEFAWDLPGVLVNFFLGVDDHGVCRSVGVEIGTVSVAPDMVRRDYRQVLSATLDLATHLRARVYDNQLGGYVDRGNLQDSINCFG